MAFSSRLRWVWELLLVVIAMGIDLLVWNGDSIVRGGQSLPSWVVPTVAAGIYPVLLLRWRYPIAVFIVFWTYGLAGLMMPLYAPFVGLLIALYALARRSRLLIAGGGLAVCVFPFAVNSYNAVAAATTGDARANFAASMVMWSALALTVWGLGRLACAAEERAVKEKQEQAAAAVRAERLHLARELHDIVSHSVSAMTLQAAGARSLASGDDERVKAALEAIETTGVHAMGELHRLLGLLRVAGSDGGLESSSQPASLRDLDTLVNSARASGVEVEVVVEGRAADLDDSVGLAAYRVVQEALTNTVKHAGLGASARIHCHWHRGGLTLTVRDWSGLETRRASKLSSGYGLAGLIERVTLVGGSLEAGPVIDGFLVQAQLPSRCPSVMKQPSSEPSHKAVP